MKYVSSNYSIKQILNECFTAGVPDGIVTFDPLTTDPLTIDPHTIDPLKFTSLQLTPLQLTPLQLTPFNQLLVYLLGLNVLFSILFVTIDPQLDSCTMYNVY